MYHGLVAIRERPWAPNLTDLTFKAASSELLDLLPLLNKVVSAVGSNVAARLVDVDQSQVTRWRKGAPISAEMGRRILACYDVLVRALRLFPQDIAAAWLFGSEPLLGGARPIDVLAVRGPAPVIRALEGIEQGAYA